jgi:hypothetical protein
LTAIFVFALGGLGTLVGPEGTMGGAALGYGVAGAMCGVETEAEVHIVAAVIDQKQGGVIPQPEPGPQIIEPYTPGAGPPIDPDTGDQLPTSNGCSSLPCKAAAVGAATVFAGGGFLGGFAIAEGEHGYPVLGPVK